MTGELWTEIQDQAIVIDLTAEGTNDLLWSGQFISPDTHARLDYLWTQTIYQMQPGFHYSKSDPMPFWRIGAVAGQAVMDSGTDDDGNFVWDFTTGLSRFSESVLFIVSEKNTVMGEDFQRRQMAFWPASELAMITDVGGYFSENWHTALELGFRKTLAAYISHSQWYQTTVYADGHNGWYGGPAGYFQVAIQGKAAFCFGMYLRLVCELDCWSPKL